MATSGTTTIPQPWTPGHTYAVGDLVTQDGVTYQALQAETAISTWAPNLVPALWKPLATSSTTTTTAATAPSPTSTPPVTTSGTVSAWNASSIYTAGMTASEAGVLYRANWWTQGNDPRTTNGGAGSGQPWTAIGTVTSSPTPVSTAAVPTAPAGLTATASTAGAATLGWAAATIPGGGTVTGYAVFENGVQVGTTTATSFSATGLHPATSYAFAVTAQDAAGSSPASTAVTLTTPPAAAIVPGATGQVFAPYVDMGLTADDDLVALANASGAHTLTLAFIQSNGAGGIGWGGQSTLGTDTLSNGSTIQAQVHALQAAGGSAIISFGGAAGTDPAAAASSAAALQAEYQSVINRYGVTSLDFDIEGAEVADTHAIALRDQALVGLRAADPGVTLSFTLPVLPTGLDYNGVAVLQAAHRDGFTPDVVNVMAMDYGSGVDNGGQMGADAIAAARATEAQLGTIGLASKLGITPMIGVNDVNSEVFTLADATMLESFAASDPKVARLSMWSMARDNGSSAGAQWASPDGSGLAQSPYAFSGVLKAF